MSRGCPAASRPAKSRSQPGRRRRGSLPRRADCRRRGVGRRRDRVRQLTGLDAGDVPSEVWRQAVRPSLSRRSSRRSRRPHHRLHFRRHRQRWRCRCRLRWAWSRGRLPTSKCACSVLTAARWAVSRKSPSNRPPGRAFASLWTSSPASDRKKHAVGFALRAEEGASEGKYQVRVTARLGDSTADGTFEVTVKRLVRPTEPTPPPPELTISGPAGLALEPGGSAYAEVRVLRRDGGELSKAPDVTLAIPEGSGLRADPGRCPPSRAKWDTSEATHCGPWRRPQQGSIRSESLPG